MRLRVIIILDNQHPASATGANAFGAAGIGGLREEG
jgi:hypothetical protein